MLSSLSSIVLAVVSSAILSRYMVKSEYGTYKLIIYVYSSLVVIFSAGLPSIFSFFLPKISLAKGKDLVDRITWLFIGLGAIFSIFLFFFSQYIAQFMGNPEMDEGLCWFSIIPILLLPTLGLDGIFTSYQQTHLMPIYNTINRVIMLACIVLPVIYIDNSALMAIKGWIAASLVSFILALVFKAIPFRGITKVNSNIKIKELFAYSLPLVTASVWGMLIRYSDQFYISKYFGPEVYAEFSNGFIEIPIVSIVTGSVSIVLMPYLSKLAVDQSNTREIIDIYRRTMVKSAYIIYPVIVYFIIYGREIMTFVFSKNYEASGIYFKINMIQSFFNIVMFMPILLAFGKTKFYSNMHLVFALISWISGFILVSIFNSPIAIAINSISMTIFLVIIMTSYIRSLLKVGILELVPIKLIITILLHSIFVALLTIIICKYLLVFTSIILNLALSAILYTIILLLSANFINLKYVDLLKPIISRVVKKYS